MASNVGDKLLWTAVILGGVAAYWYIPYILNQAKEGAVISIPQPEPSKPQLEKDAEAAIKPFTLAELADGPSYHLTASAIKLTASKFLKSDAKQLLLRDIASKDHIRRDKAIDALSLLLRNTALKDNSVRSHFADLNTFSHLVTALVNLLPDHERDPKSTSPPPSPVRPRNRPAHETAILSFIVLLLNEPRKVGGSSNRPFYIIDRQPLIDAGIITRWLKHYPFPCTLIDNRRWNFKRYDVVHLLRKEEWGNDDESMSTLIGMLMKVPEGACQLADIGLRLASVHDTIDVPCSERRLTRRYSPRDHIDSTSRAIANMNGQEIPEESERTRQDQLLHEAEMIDQLYSQGDWDSTTLRYRDGRTAGEQSLRRRHRQAIVVAEAGMPLREENILQRQPTETELNWQEEMANRDHAALERLDGMEGVGGGRVRVREGPVPPAVDLEDEDDGGIRLALAGEEVDEYDMPVRRVRRSMTDDE